MQRYFLKDTQFHSDFIQADETMHKHIKKVMRMRNGDQITVVDEKGQVFLASIEDVEQGRLKVVEKIDENHELDVQVTLIYGLPKGDKFEFILQKATELGVTRIVPFMCNRSVVKVKADKWHKKQERYKKIIQEAAEQSKRNCLPVLEEPCALKGLSDYLSQVNLVAYEESAKQGEQSTLKRALSSLSESITVIVGPEGGFDQSEIDYMQEIGIEACGLGQRILRSETAPLYLLSVIGYERELCNEDY